MSNLYEAAMMAKEASANSANAEDYKNKTAKECLNMTDLQKTAMLAKEAAGFGDAINTAKGYASQAGQAIRGAGSRVGDFVRARTANTINMPNQQGMYQGLSGNGFTAEQMAEAAAGGAGYQGRAMAGAGLSRNAKIGLGVAGAAALGGAGYAGYNAYQNKQASENVVYGEEVQMAKQAAELMYSNAIEEANEKLAFAEELFAQAEYAEKIAEDNGAGLQVPYIDQLRTPAGASIAGAMGGGAIGGVIGAMRGGAAGAAQGAAVGAASLAGAGALIAFVDQHRMARAQQLAGQ